MPKDFGKYLLIAIAAFLIVFILIAVGFIGVQYFKDKKTNDDITTLYKLEEYQNSVAVEGISISPQTTTYAFAIVSALGVWAGNPISEEELVAQNDNKTALEMGTGFLDQLNKHIPGYQTVKHEALSNTQLLAAIYKSLAQGLPVVAEFAARKDNNPPIMHGGIITGLDIPGDAITLQNTYGYEETYNLKKFINATRFEGFEDMSGFLKFIYQSGFLKRNTIYVLTPITGI